MITKLGLRTIKHKSCTYNGANREGLFSIFMLTVSQLFTFSTTILDLDQKRMINAKKI
jgi:hypothetical protein